MTDLEVFQPKSGSPPSLSLQTDVDLEGLVNLWLTTNPTQKNRVFKFKAAKCGVEGVVWGFGTGFPSLVS